MSEKIKILLLEDISSDAELINRELKKGKINCEVLLVRNRADYIRELQQFMPDVILADHTLPAFNSLEALEVLKYSGIKIPFILVSGNASEEYVVKLMKEGMDDYILKDRLQRLPDAILNALDKHRLQKEKLKAIEELQANVILMKKAEELAHLGSWQLNFTTGVTKWSDEAFRIYGYQPGEMEPNYEKFLSHLHPEDREAEKKAVDEAVKNCKPHKSEFRIIDKNGKTKYIRSELIVECNKSRQPINIIGFNLDITPQREAENK